MHPPPNRPKVSVFLAMSLDGFVAAPDGDLSWLWMGESGPLGVGGGLGRRADGR
jgi:hypothetical protein